MAKQKKPIKTTNGGATNRTIEKPSSRRKTDGKNLKIQLEEGSRFKMMLLIYMYLYITIKIIYYMSVYRSFRIVMYNVPNQFLRNGSTPNGFFSSVL